MKTIANLIALLSTLGLIGCHTAVSPTATVEPCLKGPSSGICVGATCKVEVEVTADGKIQVDPYELKVKKRSAAKMIIWKLKDPSTYEFTDKDGPKNLKNTDPAGNIDDFSDPSPTDSDDGSTPGKSGKNFKIKFSNATDAQNYSYTIQFREKKGSKKVLSCDPYINNQNQ